MGIKTGNSSSVFNMACGAGSILLAGLVAVAAAQASESSAPPTVTIPAETEVATELLSGIHTQVSHVGDAVTARLSKPLLIRGRIALPMGTLLDGRITRIRAAGRMHRPAELALRFERIALPDGQEEPVQGILSALERTGKTRLDSEGFLKGGSAISWKGLAGGLAALSAIAVTHGALAGSTAFSALIPASGGSLLTYAFVWRRGSDVHVPPDTLCRVRLIYPLTVRVAW